MVQVFQRMPPETKKELVENFGKKKAENLLPVSKGKRISRILKRLPTKRTVEEN